MEKEIFFVIRQRILVPFSRKKFKSTTIKRYNFVVCEVARNNIKRKKKKKNYFGGSPRFNGPKTVVHNSLASPRK